MTDPTARDAISTFLTDRLAARIGVRPDAIDRDADLIELGVKSIDAVIVSGDLEDRFGIEIDPTLVFEHRTVNRITEVVAADLGG
jgi:acyl carrier protein